MPAPSTHNLKQRCRGVSAGIYAAPLGALADSTRNLADWGGQLVHFDVMDGVFVPQLTAGPDFVAALDTELVRDVHLMVERPETHIARFAKAGADIITVHAESIGAANALEDIRAASVQLDRPILAGLAVMPRTPIEALAPLLELAPDLILILALDPRDTAPPCVVDAVERVRVIRKMTAPFQPLLAIDGGITEATIAEAATARPDIIVSGSAIFRAPDPAAAFARLQQAALSPAIDGVTA